VNIARFLPSVPGCLAKAQDAIYVNLFVQGTGGSRWTATAR
jgi:hypothetical protein